MINIATPPMLRGDPLRPWTRVATFSVEKPLRVGVSEARGMAAAAERRNTVTACCFNWRYAPANASRHRTTTK